MDSVLIEKKGVRGELILNRPERKNALTGPMVDALHEGLNGLIADSKVRVILLRGEGGVLCAGNDLKEFGASPSPEWLATQPQRWTALHEAMFDCPKPIVCALEGAAIAAGSALVLACDLVVAGDGARLHVAEASERIRKTPYLNTVWLMWRYGPALTLELAMTAIPLTGPQLVSRGMAVKSVPDAEILAAARAYADQVGEASSEIMASVKASVRHLSQAGFREIAEKVMGIQQSGTTNWSGTKGLKDS